MTDKSTFIFILSWERPIYTWMCLDSLYRCTRSPAKIVIADNASSDPLVRQVIAGFERRDMFHGVHYFPDNDPARLNTLVEMYWEEIGEYFVFVESDICVFPGESDWLSTMTDHMDVDPEIGSIGSRVHNQDFISMPTARALEPDIEERKLGDLIKINAPMRTHIVTDEPLVSPHHPPLSLLTLRKKAYAEVGFGRDTEIHKSLIKKGWKSLISNEVEHRHLTLMNIYDYPNYDTAAHNDYFDSKKNDALVPSRSTPDNAVIILGMHRSGTSCLAGSLEEAGLHLGDVVTSAPYNKKGNRENKSAMQLHEDVLTSNGGAWNKPPDKIHWSERQLEQLDALIGSYPTKGCWGIKDPRMLLVIDAWMKRLKSPRFVGSIRHPVEVVRSLRSRHKDYKDDSILFNLWYSYNRLLIDRWKSSPFPIVNFNCSSEEYARQINQVSEQLQLPSAHSSGDSFFDESLRHEDGKDSAMPSHVETLYTELLDVAISA